MSESETPHERPVVLLVDDDLDDREIFAEALFHAGNDVELSLKKDGEELMSYLAETAVVPDLIFLDLNMPRKNGKECLTEIQKDDRFRNIPVIIYTTSINPMDVEETFHVGASYFFRKPPSFQELTSLLSNIFSSRMYRKRADGIGNYLIKREAR